MILVEEVLRQAEKEVIEEPKKEIITEARCRMAHKGARTNDEMIYLLEMEVRQYREENKRLKDKLVEKKGVKQGTAKKVIELEKEVFGREKIAFEGVNVKEIGGKVIVTEQDGTLLLLTEIENVKKFNIEEA